MIGAARQEISRAVSDSSHKVLGFLFCPDQRSDLLPTTKI